MQKPRRATEVVLAKPLTFELKSLDDTNALAATLACALATPMTIALSGTLGAGKTQLIRYLAEQLGVPAEEVTSPTYVLMQRYVGKLILYHFDFYRLETDAQVWDLGIDELYEQPVVNLIEWADKFPQCLPEDHLSISIEQTEAGERLAVITSSGPRSSGIVSNMRLGSI